MNVITSTGPRYQSKIMPTAQAFRFAKMIQANPQYEEVEVHHLGGRRYRVTYRAKDENRQRRILQRQQEARAARAATCEPDKYGATAHSCSCPDWLNRLQEGALGVFCKHIVAVRKHEEEMAEARRLKAEQDHDRAWQEAQDRRAYVDAEIASIFGTDGFGG